MWGILAAGDGRNFAVWDCWGRKVETPPVRRLPGAVQMPLFTFGALAG